MKRIICSLLFFATVFLGVDCKPNLENMFASEVNIKNNSDLKVYCNWKLGDKFGSDAVVKDYSGWLNRFDTDMHGKKGTIVRVYKIEIKDAEKGNVLATVNPSKDYGENVTYFLFEGSAGKYSVRKVDQTTYNTAYTGTIRPTIWALGFLGKVCCRVGATSDNPFGSRWKGVGTHQGANSSKIVISNNAVWSISNFKGFGLGSLYCRKGISLGTPEGTSWTGRIGTASDVATSPDGKIVWHIGTLWQPYCRIGMTLDNPVGTEWRKIEAPKDGCSEIILTNNSAWALGVISGFGLKSLYCRSGITPDKPEGDKWTNWEAASYGVAISPDGKIVWHIGAAWRPHYRVGVTTDNPVGTDWKPVSGLGGGASKIVLTNNSAWAIAAIRGFGLGSVYCRKGITPDKPEGTEWTGRLGTASEIYVSPDGNNVLMIGAVNKIYFREGITSDKPEGTSWKEIGGWATSVVAGTIYKAEEKTPVESVQISTEDSSSTQEQAVYSSTQDDTLPPPDQAAGQTPNKDKTQSVPATAPESTTSTPASTTVGVLVSTPATAAARAPSAEQAPVPAPAPVSTPTPSPERSPVTVSAPTAV